MILLRRLAGVRPDMRAVRSASERPWEGKGRRRKGEEEDERFRCLQGLEEIFAAELEEGIGRWGGQWRVGSWEKEGL